MKYKYDFMVNQVNNIISQYRERLTVRQIYYRCVADHGRENSKNSYGSLVKFLVKARENNDVDYRRIEDRSRSTLGGDFGYDDLKDFLNSQINSFADATDFVRKLWANQDKYVEVWVEKDALSRVLSNVASGLRVRTAPSKGYSSFSYIMNAINRFPDVDPINGKKIVILHFADHDPSGIDMTGDLERRISKYGNYDIDPNPDDETLFQVKRIALNIDQVRARDLIAAPAKLTDSRAKDYIRNYGDKCWELDAIRPNELTEMVRNAILNEMDVELFNQTVSDIKKQQKDLKPKMKEAEKLLKDFFKDDMKGE